MKTIRTFSDYIASVIPGKVRKISVNAGLGCPNRDGTVGSGGCIFCNNDAFCPRYTRWIQDITAQIEEGIRFTANKGRADSYLVYFQSYSNTYGETDKLIGLYEEALAYLGVSGLVIATRPDCLAAGLLDYFESRFGRTAPAGHPFLLVELGVESTNDSTLEAINRGHDYACAVDAVNALDKRGIAVGVHLILGLPGETEEDWTAHARRISELPVTTLKLHQLQIIKGTTLARMYDENPGIVSLPTAEEYAASVRRFVAALRDGIYLDRFVSETPRDMVVAPSWGLKPSEFQKLL